jgi:hypothetical protein
MYHNKNQNFTYRAGARGEDGCKEGGREKDGRLRLVRQRLVARREGRRSFRVRR